MRKEYTRDMGMEDEMEDIRQVPLEPGTRGESASNRPVGSSYMGGPAQDQAAPRRRSRAKGGRAAADGAAAHARTGEDTSGGRTRAAGETSPRRVRPTAEEAPSGRSRPTADETPSRRVSPTAKEAPPRRVKPAADTGGRRPIVSFLCVILALVIGVGAGLGGGYYLWEWERPYTVDLKAAEVPEWVKQEFIRKNIFSRPDVSRQRVNNIVIHYVGNPGSTAEGNRNYFDSLADQDPQKSGTSTSSHFVVGLEGEVIQCIPITEIAYGNAPRNNDTISIEVCHPDETGKYNDATYESVVNLTAWLCNELKLSAKDVIRHYDVNGKICPKYFVDHEDAWDQFLADVKEAMKAAI